MGNHLAHLAVSTDRTVQDARVGAVRMNAAATAELTLLYDDHSDWARRFRIDSVPTILVLDTAGQERYRHVGHLTSEDLLQVSEAIAGLPATAEGDP